MNTDVAPQVLVPMRSSISVPAVAGAPSTVTEPTKRAGGLGGDSAETLVALKAPLANRIIPRATASEPPLSNLRTFVIACSIPVLNGPGQQTRPQPPPPPPEEGEKGKGKGIS